ncbi:hypothetical protein C8R48DRAFT_780331 [Suillus tomentosus]|nr:hypothetical protein C8R48DRAFT_780331 [Suillus tomentosus]
MSHLRFGSIRSPRYSPSIPFAPYPTTMNNRTTSSVPVVEYACGHTKVAVDEYYPCGACIGRVLMPACCVDLIAGATVALFRRPEHAKDFHSVVEMSCVTSILQMSSRMEKRPMESMQSSKTRLDKTARLYAPRIPRPRPYPPPLALTLGFRFHRTVDLVANKVVGFLYRPEYLERLRCVIRDVVFELHDAEKNGVDTEP